MNNDMKWTFPDMPQVITATFTSLLILLSATFLAQQVQNSSYYQQSRFFSTLFSQESVGVLDIISDRENIDVLTKFAVAVTGAYIDFELIPVNEAKTFTAVFESLDGDVSIERFEYQRKDLLIYGIADTHEACEAFQERLRETGHFAGISGHTYTATDDTIRFQVLCTSFSGQSDATMVFLPIFS